MRVQREDQGLVERLSLEERVTIESQSWDRWALQQQAQGRFQLSKGGLYPGMPISEAMRRTFPQPASLWVSGGKSARKTSGVWEYEHLAPMQGKTVLQVGGAGEHVIKFILAGAARGFCIDPSLETLKLGRKKAELYGVASHIEFIRAIAERLPFPDQFFDAIHGNAVIHHTLPDHAAREIYRVLKPMGRASFHDPLEGYALARFARKYLPYPGKGDEGVDYPLTYEVVRAFIDVFPEGEYRESELFGVPLELLRRINKNFLYLTRALQPLDDYLVQHYQPLRRFCKAIAIRVTRLN
jgi:SAM-dependent methyltransferase